MGDFSMACGATGMSLMNVKVVLIPLLRAEYWKEADQVGAHIVGYEGAACLYRPATLPIFGTLDSYGQLEDIERDENVEFLEKKLGVPIEVFANICSYGYHTDEPEREKVLTALVGPPREPFILEKTRKDPKAVKAEIKEFAETEKESRRAMLRGMLVHRAAWDKMTSEGTDESGDPEWSLWDGGRPSSETLKLLGFKFVKETKDERYNQKFVHPDIPGLVGMSDGSYTNFRLRGKKEEGVYRLKNLAKFVRLPAKMVALAKKTPASLLWVMDKLTDDRPRYDRDRNAIYQLYEELILKKVLKPGTSLDRLHETMNKMKMPEHLTRTFLEIYYTREVVRGPVLDAFANLLAFTSFMGSANRLFGPTWNGPQYGNFHATKALAELTAKLAQARINRCKD